MRAGIIGLSSVGKSTLFEILTGTPTPAPGSRPEPRVGMARVPDPRVDRLAEIFNPRKTTHATVEYVDVPGVQKGSALVDLPALRNIDLYVHVVRGFESDTVPHAEGSIDPLRDARFLELELMLADLGAVERRIERLELNIKKTHRAEDAAERELFLRLKQGLEEERPLREQELSPDERRRLRNYALLTERPTLIVLNTGEDQLRDAQGAVERSGLSQMARESLVQICPVSATIEAEIARLGAEDARMFLDDLGLEEPGLNRVVRASYELLGYISFLTVGEDECRAWTIQKGTRAQQAAGAVHSDIERGFIRAEVIPFESLVECGSLAVAREKGRLRLEGKEYAVQDGDVVHFRFNV
jgi:GTP-binding protein YchF